MNMIKEELLSILNYIETKKSNHIFIPEIKVYIEEMLECFDVQHLQDKERLVKLSLFLGRVITDDPLYFNNSELGSRILSLIKRINNT